MCIYCGTTNYRKIYIQHNGPIPKEENGRAYEIHHIDGNHSNNDPINLKCVTLQEHYDIHHSNGDYAACLIMSARMSLSVEDKSILAKKSVRRQLTNGKHPWTGGEHQRKLALTRSSDGSHPFLGGEIQREHNLRRLADSSHHFLIRQTCEHCGKQANPGMYGRWHGENCRNKNA